MTQYIKKPIPVEAFQLGVDKEPSWFTQAIADGIVNSDDKFTYIHTLEGVHCAVNGCYVIKGVEGELYPCKESIFNKTYQEVK